MSNFNKVIRSLQKIKSKILGQNLENLVHYLLLLFIIVFQMMKQKF